MRAISLKCPHCAAKLEAPEAAHTVACNYCGTRSRIQHRTRYLERKIDLPPPPPQERNLPVAKQKHGTRWLVSITSLLPLVGAGGATYFSLKQSGSFSQISAAISEATGASGSPSPGSESWSYSGAGSVIFYDVDGDGAQDVIGRVRYVQQDDTYRVAAFEGLHGKRLWETEVFGNHRDSLEGQTGLHGEYLLQSDSRGNLSGYSVKNGGTLWKVSMGEKLHEMCGIDAGHIALGLKDKQWKSVQLRDGSMTPLESRPAACATLNTHDDRGQASHNYTTDKRGSRPRNIRVDGMRVSDTLSLSGDEGHSLLLGHKTPGTRVPMLAMAHSDALDSDESAGTRSKRSKKKSKSRLIVDWVAEMPALDPLRVREGAPTLATMNASFIAAVYMPDKGSPHVVCFSREGGHRLWDTALPAGASHTLRAIDISKARVYLSQWGRLDALDVGDGKLMFTLGK